MGEEQQITPDVVQRLVENHKQFLAFLRTRVANEFDAEEILQSAFVRVAERGHQLRDGELAVAWFYRLLRNALVDYYRRQGTRQRAMEAVRQNSLEASEVDHELERAVCHCVKGLIPTLKQEYSELINQVDINGLTVSDAARILGISANNASVRLHRARTALRERLVQVCGTCTEHGCLDCHCKSG